VGSLTAAAYGRTAPWLVGTMKSTTSAVMSQDIGDSSASGLR
jgi:hypothetical protein